MKKFSNTRSWPWFALAGLLVVASVILRGGIAAAVVLVLAVMTFVGACIRAVRGSVDDVDGMEKIGRGMGLWS